MKQFLFLLILIPALSFGQSENALELYGNGVKLFYEESYDSSIIYFDQAIAEDANFQFAYYNRALALVKTKGYKEAILDFSTVIELDSQYVDAYLYRSECYLKISAYDEAIQDIYFLIANNPNIVEPYKNLGLCYYYKRKYALANEAYQVYLESYPMDVAAWYQKGLSNYYHADYEQGIQDFSKVYALNENYVTAIEWRGKCYQKSNYIQKACLDWNLALEKGSKSAQELKDKYCIGEE